MLMLKMKSLRQMAFEQWKFQPQERGRKWAFSSKGWSHQALWYLIGYICYILSEDWQEPYVKPLCDSAEDTSLIPYYVISKGIGPVVKNNMLHMKYRFIRTQASYLWFWLYGFNNLFFQEGVWRRKALWRRASELHTMIEGEATHSSPIDG